MATNFNENSIVSSGGFKPSSKDTPLDIRTRVETEQDIYEIPNPYIGMIVYVKDTGKRFEILTLKEVDMGLTTKNVVDTYKQFTVDLEEYAKIEDVPTKVSELENDKGYLVNQDISGKADVEDIPTKVSELENDRGYATERFVDSKIETINNTVNSNTNTINSKINTINSNINTINSNINTINTEIDNINTDLTNVSENIEDSLIFDSKDGYLKDIEILGNTIQDQDNLADIRSVGDKLENQELYEIPVLSCGKNLVGVNLLTGKYNNDTGEFEAFGATTCNTTPIKVNSNTMYVISRPTLESYLNNRIFFYDKYMNYIGNVLTVGDSNFETPSNAKYINFQVATSLGSDLKVQIEEGTVATPYEPYQEHKLTILSPVQLEKVGEVADRIVCKDGVWGVEKKIVAKVLNGSEVWARNNSWTSSDYSRFHMSNFDTINGNILKVISDKFVGVLYSDMDNREYEIVSSYNNGLELIIHISNSKLSTVDSQGFKKWLKENPTTVKYQTTQPTFIPLPYDQQIKLRTFASKTNIHFGCEIEPTLKASVPKSLSSTVSTHTEQIDNLGKELDKVKKLEESTVSTVTTESDFITVENTSNGYFEGVKLDGRTLVNLYENKQKTFHKYYIFTKDEKINLSLFKPNTVYTAIILDETDRINCTSLSDNFGTIGLYMKVYDKIFTFKTPSDFSNLSSVEIRIYAYSLRDANDFIKGDENKIKYVILEGDHTQNPPSFFEGLKSVGQDVDDITIATTNAPMFFGKGGKK